jgi:hypothetical protein
MLAVISYKGDHHDDVEDFEGMQIKFSVKVYHRRTWKVSQLLDKLKTEYLMDVLAQVGETLGALLSYKLGFTSTMKRRAQGITEADEALHRKIRDDGHHHQHHRGGVMPQQRHSDDVCDGHSSSSFDMLESSSFDLNVSAGSSSSSSTSSLSDSGVLACPCFDRKYPLNPRAHCCLANNLSG